jgi:hypothetical protein
MGFLLDLMPWWGWFVISIGAGVLALRWFGFNGLTAALVVGAAASTYAKGRKSGVATEQAKQQQADNKARETIHDIKEDVRSIPDTPAGKAERDERFSRWED